MQVTAVSGNAVAQLDEHELHCMVENRQTVRDLKRRLSPPNLPSTSLLHVR